MTTLEAAPATVAKDANVVVEARIKVSREMDDPNFIIVIIVL